MKALFICVLALIATTSSVAQDAPTVTYKVKSTDENAGVVQAYGEPFNVSVGNMALNVWARGGVRFYRDHIFAGFSGDLRYFENADSFTEHGYSVYADQSPRNADGIIGYWFSKTKGRKMQFKLKSEGQTTYVTEVYVPFKQLIGPEIGISSGYTKQHFENQTGGDLLLKDFYTGSMTRVEESFSTYRQYTWLYLGGSISKLVNATVFFDGYGDRSNEYLKRVYFHLIVPVASTYEDIYMDNARLLSRYVVNDMARMPLGARLGSEYWSLGSGLGYGLEAALLPGLKEQMEYSLTIRFTAMLGFKLPGVKE